MAKKIDGYIKLQIPAGQANPSPPVGPALGQKGVNIMEFCKAFNAETQGLEPGLPIPVVITVYSDKSFTFIKKTPPASVLLRKIAGIKPRARAPRIPTRWLRLRARSLRKWRSRSGPTSPPRIWTRQCAPSLVVHVRQVSRLRGLTDGQAVQACSRVSRKGRCSPQLPAR
jgi:hypothetical protein